MARTRREAMAMLASGLAAGTLLTRGMAIHATPAGPPTSDPDSASASLLTLLPEAQLRAGVAGTDDGSAPASRRCDDGSSNGRAALALAIGVVRLQSSGDTRALLDRAAATTDIRYGSNDPLAAIHRPYVVTPFAGPHIDTTTALRLIQPLGNPGAIDAWQAKLAAWGDALLGAASAIRTDEAAGCLPPAALSRASLLQMDGFILAPAASHPLLAALDDRIADPAQREAARKTAARTLEAHVQPAMAILRDTVAGVTRRGRSDPGAWAQPGGDALHAANLARAGDTALSPADAQAFARDKAKEVAALLDKRLAARGLNTGSLAERIGAAFGDHPGLIAADDADGRAGLIEAARSKQNAAMALLPKMLPKGGATPPSLDIKPLPEDSRDIPAGSFYLPAAIDGSRGAMLWIDNRSVFALPVPGVSPLSCHLGFPGAHLLASLSSADRPLLSRMAAWPAFTEGWCCYAERLAATDGLFARDPWGDIARLSDELLRSARLVVDVGIHAQRWTRAEATQAMTEMTGAPQEGAIDRIVAMPGEVASYTLGLEGITKLHDAAKKAAGKAFDERRFHAGLVEGGPRPFSSVSA